MAADDQHVHGRQQGTDDFTGFANYRPGDSIKSIDWKAFAREQPLLVKRFSGAGARQLVLRWREAGTGDTERRLSQLCRWVLDAERLGLNYGLQLPGLEIAPSQGELHRRECLRALACFEDDASAG